jgi:hypothetical protein
MIKLLLLIAFSADPVQITQPQLIENHPIIVQEDQSQIMLKTIKHFTFLTQNFSNPKIYQNFQFDKKKFADLNEFEKDMFYVIQGKDITIELGKIHRMAIDKSMANAMQGVSDPNLLTFTKELYTLRKSHAVIFEKFMEEKFKKHAKELTEKEILYYLSKTKEFHKAEKLK